MCSQIVWVRKLTKNKTKSSKSILNKLQLEFTFVFERKIKEMSCNVQEFRMCCKVNAMKFS